VRAAASLELLHTFALIHDDIMDASPDRRGIPSAYRRAAGRFKSGEGINEPERRGLSAAVLAGDLALVLSDRMFVESGFDASDIARAWDPLTQMRLEAVGGQYLDLVTRGTPAGAPDGALTIAALKTAGYSVKGPMVFGAKLAGADEGRLAALSAFGEKVGIAFQLADDLAGLLGDPAVTGKDAEADARRGSPTRLIAQTMQMASPSQRKTVRAIWGNPHCTAADLGKIRALVVETGAVAAAVDEIKTMVSEASARLGQAKLKPGAVGMLCDLAGSIAAAATMP
ncbi:MAG: polyprenyl synthetase family protein, partial [Actinomycetota bacterium]